MQHNGDIKALLKSIDFSFTHYGSEFRPVSLLDQLLKNHSKWPLLQSMITNGIEYPMEPISDEDRKTDIKFHIERGNHKSATCKEGLMNLNKAYNKEVKFGWQIPFLPSSIEFMKDACITPLGIASQ